MPRAVLANPTVFRAHLAADRLKAMVASAKSVSDLVTFQVDSLGHDGKDLMRYWAVDDVKPRISLIGVVHHAMFKACEGDDSPHTFQVPTKVLTDAITPFDMKRDIEIKLTVEETRLLLTLHQAKDDDSEPDVRTLAVQPSDSKPYVPIIPKGAYAAVDLARFGKVLTGLKKNTDVVTVTISPEEFEVASSTKRVQDGWCHATTAVGKATGLFSAEFLRKAVAGAGKADSFGEVRLVDDFPLRVEAVSEDLNVVVYVAGREVMR